jgi:hypothetical protein
METLARINGMIRDVLVPALSAKFPGRGMRTGVPPDPIAIFPAAHAAVGDVSIWDDDEEATVGIGDITHHHFNPYNSNLTDPESEQWITQAVVEFLEKLFADRVLLQKGRTCAWGSMQWLEDGEGIPPPREDGDAFLWSGPLTQE